MKPAIFPLGDSAINITFGNVIDDSIHQQVMHLYNSLIDLNLDGVVDIIPAYASLTVVYSVVQIKQLTSNTCYDYMQQKIATAFLLTAEKRLHESRHISIPVCYHVSLAGDLVMLSIRKQISIDEIIRIHTATMYRVYMIGFLPGFAYMGKVEEKIACDRKAGPTGVPAGSVGIAGNQTGIYPLDSPGGWNIIGRTPLRIFDADRNEPCLLQAGDQVSFHPLSLAEFETYQAI